MPQQPQCNQQQHPTGYSSANLVPQNTYSMLGSIGRESGTLQRIYQPNMQYGGTDDDFDLCLKFFMISAFHKLNNILKPSSAVSNCSSYRILYRYQASQIIIQKSRCYIFLNCYKKLC
ncbi:hypothetical protein GcM1_224064 [Golovinomyces cichoracearum]|uniref:Uncharacterized protein n=1 Tax=Golovinomyces cichoracearum TaxID=62708 RepID=A0A420IQR2_9PEZI|nr:hypothetical protein GcM1_224064 [Golovinomyces cichoracearum]